MIIIKKVADLQNHLLAQKKEGKKIGFVPTMGALHQGHLSLLKQCIEQNEITVCSIFVNPTQFNNQEDFKHYPKTVEKDIELLVEVGCSVLFLPSTDEIYPPGFQPRKYDLGDLETKWEGQYRPGHFQGVCQVMDRLLSIVDPDRLYLGQKDFQQCMVIKKLEKDIFHDRTEIKIVPTQREKDGLAMSSRNLRLSAEQRQKATAIYQSLLYIKEQTGTQANDALTTTATSILNDAGFSVDYVTVVQQETLMPIAVQDGQPAVALIAATIGNIRLIDNMILN